MNVGYGELPLLFTYSIESVNLSRILAEIEIELLVDFMLTLLFNL